MVESSGAPVVGIDLGGTNMQVGVVSADGRMLGRAKRKTKAASGSAAVLDRIAEAVREACESAGCAVDSLLGIGIGAPGPVDPQTGVVREAVNLRWNQLNLSGELGDRLARPVVSDNDVNVAVVGEHRYGAGRGAMHMLGVWVGTGVGAGLILNGRLFYGRIMSAGEIGHTVLVPSSPRGHRSVEHNCSRTSIVDRLTRLISSNHPSIIPELVDGDLSRIKSRTIGEAYRANDALTVEVVNQSADLLGIAIANACTLLSLDRIILGGGLTEAVAQPFVDRVAQSAREHVFPADLRELTVAASELEDDAGVFGAAWLARERFGSATGG